MPARGAGEEGRRGGGWRFNQSSDDPERENLVPGFFFIFDDAEIRLKIGRNSAKSEKNLFFLPKYPFSA